MNWIKGWLVKLLGPKFIRDKLAVALAALGGYLVSKNVASAEQAQALTETLLPILSNAAVIVLGLILSINSTEKGK